MLKFSLAVCLSLTLFSLSHAATYHVLPKATGTNDGTSWENAYGPSQLQSTVDTLKPGDLLLIGSGTYEGVSLKISCQGEPQNPILIRGHNSGAGLPVLKSSWTIDDPTKGATAIQLDEKVSHLSVSQVQIDGYKMGIVAHPCKTVESRNHISFREIDIRNCRHGFYLSDCDDLSLEACRLVRYSKHGFRFEQGCDRVQLKNCVADCSEADAEWEKKTELFPFGFNINNGGTPNTQFHLEDCTAANNMMPLQKKRYKNGDGFVMEGNTQDVSLVRCKAIRNQDGGYDLKVDDISLKDCIGIGNGRQVRIWTTGTLENCYFGYGGTGLWNNGGPLSVNQCTFYKLGVAAMTDDKAKQKITLSNCVIADCTKTYKKTASGGGVILDDTLVEEADSSPSTDAKPATRPVPEWDGVGSPTAPETISGKGYQPLP